MSAGHSEQARPTDRISGIPSRPWVVRSATFAFVYAARMDVVADMLRSAQGSGSLLLQTLHDPPWAVHYRPSPPLTLHAFVRGGGWVAIDNADPLRLAEREMAVVRGPSPHRVADALDTPAHLVVEGTARCEHAARARPEPVRLAPRTYGRSGEAGTIVLSGVYPVGGQVGSLLLDALPPVLRVPADSTSAALLEAFLHELPVEEPGQQTVLDRLLDTLLVRGLRSWFAGSGAASPSWYRALGDPVAGNALWRLHERPGHPWTVGSLAAAVGVSRASLARRFKEQVGQSPLAYLTHWRMTLAARMLREPGPTVTEIAHRVGYTDPFAFTTAFKRFHGATPSAYRDHERRRRERGAAEARRG